jgi:hypothetical protein
VRDADLQRWARQWSEAAGALEEQRRSELRALTANRALAASDALLSVASPGDLPADQRGHSGLVEQQRLFRLVARMTATL